MIVINMMAIGKTTNLKEKEYSTIMMAIDMKVIIKMIYLDGYESKKFEKNKILIFYYWINKMKYCIFIMRMIDMTDIGNIIKRK